MMGEGMEGGEARAMPVARGMVARVLGETGGVGTPFAKNCEVKLAPRQLSVPPIEHMEVPPPGNDGGWDPVRAHRRFEGEERGT